MRRDALLAHDIHIEEQADEKGSAAGCYDSSLAGRHQKCVECRMQQHGDEPRQDEIQRAFILVPEACPGEEIAHGDGEEEVAGNGNEAPEDANGKP